MDVREKAKAFAREAHKGQVRKTTGFPMIGHPIRVAKILEKAQFLPEVVAAGYLHDTVEDTSVTMEEIEREFGPMVRDIVAGNTENKEHTWEERKQHTIDSIQTAPLAIRALIVADKLDNLTSLIEDYEALGEDIWKDFKRGREQQKWYFTEIAKHMETNLDGISVPSFFAEYKQKVATFFG